MEFLKFTLSGEYATFVSKTLDKCIYTYSHIHPVALKGLLGAVLGFNGYEHSLLNPEFFLKLCNLKVGIVPAKPKFKIEKKSITPGSKKYARYGHDFEEIALVNPSWTIYLPLQDSNVKKLVSKLTTKSYTYPIYLGDEIFKAEISNVEIIDLTEQKLTKTNSLIYYTSINEAKQDKVLYDLLPVKLQNGGYYKKKIAFGTNEVLSITKGYVDGNSRFVLI